MPLFASMLVPLVTTLLLRLVAQLRCRKTQQETEVHQEAEWNANVPTMNHGVYQHTLDAVVPDVTFPYIAHQGNLSIMIRSSPGRPPMPDVVQALAISENPGVFLCGPQRLLDNVKQAAKRVRKAPSLGCAATLGCSRLQCSFYEESSDI